MILAVTLGINKEMVDIVAIGVEIEINAPIGVKMVISEVIVPKEYVMIDDLRKPRRLPSNRLPVTVQVVVKTMMCLLLHEHM